jgi:cation diffusion facilitator family transporter
MAQSEGSEVLAHPQEADRWQRIHAAASPHLPDREWATRRVLALTAATMAVELVAGYATGSMALVADGWHMSAHALAMGLAYAAHLASRNPTVRRRMSFGTGKISALGAYTSALLLAAIALLAGAQSVARLIWPEPVAFVPAILVAGLGLVVNVASVRILRADSHADTPRELARRADPQAPAGHRHDPSHAAAIAHVVADATTSVLAIVALLGGRIFGWGFLDPITGLVGCALVLFWSAGLVRRSARTLLDFTPSNGVESAIREVVARSFDATVADVHVWEFAAGQLACQLTLVAHEPLEPERVRTALSGVPGLAHVTVEINACREAH